MNIVEYGFIAITFDLIVIMEVAIIIILNHRLEHAVLFVSK